jgi:hypothetical protein
VANQLKPMYTDFRAGKMAVGEYADRAHKLISDQLVPTKR